MRVSVKWDSYASACETFARGEVEDYTINIVDGVPNANYCASKGTPWEHWIESISLFATIHQNPPKSMRNKSVKEGYGDFTHLPPMEMRRGTGILTTLVPRASWQSNPLNANLFWSIWVDWNQDNDFDDPGEQVIKRGVTFYTDTFLDNEIIFGVPATARLGKTRLRLSMKAGSDPLPCETFGKGEVEDYTVNVTASLEKIQTQPIDNQNITHFNIFPNPANQEAFLDLKDFENQSVELKVSDIAGKAIFNQTIEKGSVAPHRLNTTSLKTGTYFIEIQSVEQRITRQLYILN
jgi:hypothetical protein